MKNFIKGIVKFQSEVFPRDKHIYQQLADGQQPHTLFIGCSDSRIVPNDMLQAGPGELFILRNAGNIVPPYGESLGGVSATVDYALHFLKVKHIVVCGHSDCGAMRALMNPEKIKEYRAVYQWLHHAERVTAITNAVHGDLEKKDYLARLIEENVIAQIDNLMTYPSVAATVRSGAAFLHGLVFDIATGEFTMLDRASYAFKPLTEVASLDMDRLSHDF